MGLPVGFTMGLSRRPLPKDKPMTNDDFKIQTIKSINDLHSLNKQQMNRLLAVEGLLHALLNRVQPEALSGLLEEYEQACDRLATQLDPKFQMPQYWREWSTAITDLQKHHQHK